MNQELPSYPSLASFDEISIWKKALHSRSFVIGAVLALVILIAGITSVFWTPYAIDVLDVSKRLKPMSSEFWFGTDQYGRDIFSMLMVGARTSIIVALIAVGIGMLIGVPLGLLAAAQKGFLEELVMRTNDLIFAFPSLLSAVLITSIFGPGTINAVIAIGIFNIPVFARVARGGACLFRDASFCLPPVFPARARF